MITLERMKILSTSLTQSAEMCRLMMHSGNTLGVRGQTVRSGALGPHLH